MKTTGALIFVSHGPAAGMRWLDKRLKRELTGTDGRLTSSRIVARSEQDDRQGDNDETGAEKQSPLETVGEPVTPVRRSGRDDRGDGGQAGSIAELDRRVHQA